MNKTQFFNYLANGGKVQMISFHGEQLLPGDPMHEVRQAQKVQTNAIMFNNGSWLYKADFKATDITPVAIGDEQPGVNVGWAIYKLVK